MLIYKIIFSLLLYILMGVALRGAPDVDIQKYKQTDRQTKSRSYAKNWRIRISTSIGLGLRSPLWSSALYNTWRHVSLVTTHLQIRRGVWQHRCVRWRPPRAARSIRRRWSVASASCIRRQQPRRRTFARRWWRSRSEWPRVLASTGCRRWRRRLGRHVGGESRRDLVGRRERQDAGRSSREDLSHLHRHRDERVDRLHRWHSTHIGHAHCINIDQTRWKQQLCLPDIVNLVYIIMPFTFWWKYSFVYRFTRTCGYNACTRRQRCRGDRFAPQLRQYFRD